MRLTHPERVLYPGDGVTKADNGTYSRSWQNEDEFLAWLNDVDVDEVLRTALRGCMVEGKLDGKVLGQLVSQKFAEPEKRVSTATRAER